MHFKKLINNFKLLWHKIEDNLKKKKNTEKVKGSEDVGRAILGFLACVGMAHS